MQDRPTRNEDNLFKTPNTALAAYLYSLGYRPIETDTSKFPATFIFESSNGLKEATHAFNLAKAEGNIVLFHTAYKMLLNTVVPYYKPKNGEKG